MATNYRIRQMQNDDLGELSSVYVRAFDDPQLKEDWSAAAAEALHRRTRVGRIGDRQPGLGG